MRALAFSGGKDSMACLHLLRENLACAIYVDTGYSYPETQDMVDYARTMLPVHVVRSDRAGQNAAVGLPSDVVPIDWTVMGQSMTCRKPVLVQSYLQCCFENIGQPLLDIAKKLGVTHLVYGQRQDESHRSTSANGASIEGITRVHPIEEWSASQVLDYLATKMTVPAHYTIAHSSLDCYDCTAFAKVSQDRLAWTKTQYPSFYAEYAVRANALYGAIQEAV